MHEVIWKDTNDKVNKKYLVIMNNVFKFKDFDIGVRFDLKGSSQDRACLAEDKTILDHCATEKVKSALKCNDFRKHMEKITFKEERGKKKFTDIVKADADFLAHCHIMDYSLLIGQILVLSDQTRI